MNWTPFLLGIIVGAITFDLLWRLSMHFSNKLIAAQRDYIEVLRGYLGLKP